MTKTNTDLIDPQDSAASEFKSYAVGFFVSLLLTIGAFAAVIADLPSALAITLVCVAALLQITTHLRNFLHLSFTGGQAREDMLLVLFSSTLLAIMVGGTVLILTDLRGRMHTVDPVTQTSMEADASHSPAH